jgi:hypothetical protein
MLEHELDAADSILYLRPRAALAKEDFDGLAREVDPFIYEHGELAGIIVEAGAFPGWESFGAMAAHFRFVRDHHKQIKKIAVVTDSAMGTVAEKLASHFVSATVRHFGAREVEAARAWVLRDA